MKKLLIICLVLVFASVAFAGTSVNDATVDTIRDGEVIYKSTHYLAGDIIPKGYDEFGYNYHTHIFNGLYANVYLGGDGFPPYEGDDGDYYMRLSEEGFNKDVVEAKWYWPYRNDSLLMKWNEAWMSKEDKDLDGSLDRHWGFDLYIGSGAWETNVQSGTYEINGEEFSWNYFCKIIAVPADAYLENGLWFSADGEEIGPVIWGQFAITQEVYNDQGEGIHGQQYLSPAFPGLGNLTSETEVPDE